MQLSTNLPYAPKAIREHLASGEVLSMNVSREADCAFLTELERIDPNRYGRLAKAIMSDALREEESADSVRTPRTFKMCPGCGRRFLARRANNLTCSDRCRKRVTRMGPVSQISETTLPKAA